MLKKVPGLLLTITIAIIAKIISPYLGQLGSVTTAIILGILISNTIPLSSHFSAGLKFSEKQLLSTAIMLLGFNLQLKSLASIGIFPLLIIVIVQCITILTGIGLGKLFGFSKKTSLLLGVGNAVCGSSAIAAVSPVINAEESDTGISIGVVNFLGTIGIFLVPALAIKVLNYSDLQASTMIGGSLQAVGQVVAAGFSVNDKVGEISTVIKMARIAMLGPIILVISLFLNQKRKNVVNSEKVQKKNLVPAIIVWFIIFSIIRSLADYFNLSQHIPWHTISQISKFILTVAMVGIGMKIKFADLLKQGPKSLTVGALIFLVQLTSIIVLEYLLFSL
jgi:uncharacterized integral membrane protein (TIGR00698 family)